MNRSRDKRVSFRQQEVLLDYMEDVQGYKTRNSQHDNQSWKERWCQLSNNLNALGTIKTSDQWSRVWNDWKYSTKKKFILIKNHETVQLEQPGIDTVAPKPLSDMEQRIVKLLGWENEANLEYRHNVYRPKQDQHYGEVSISPDMILQDSDHPTKSSPLEYSTGDLEMEINGETQWYEIDGEELSMKAAVDNSCSDSETNNIVHARLLGKHKSVSNHNSKASKKWKLEDPDFSDQGLAMAIVSQLALLTEAMERSAAANERAAAATERSAAACERLAAASQRSTAIRGRLAISNDRTSAAAHKTSIHTERLAKATEDGTETLKNTCASINSAVQECTMLLKDFVGKS